MEIVLLRHGKPKVELSGYLSAKELKNLVLAYTQSNIKDRPSETLKKYFKDHYVVCSNLLRSIESAKNLNFKNIHVSDELYRETNIPHFDNSFVKLPIMVWLILFRVLWLFGFSKNGEPYAQAKIRSKQAAGKLVGLAESNEKIIVVGHGLMNRLIGYQLEKKGWQASKREGKRYWELKKYTFNP